MSTASHTVCIVIPVYRPILTGWEKFSFERSIPHLGQFDVELIAPPDLNLDWYLERCPQCKIRHFASFYFESIRGYNQLMLDPDFYAEYQAYEFILVLQTDAMLLSAELQPWLNSNFDYIGAPWPQGHELFVNTGRFEGQYGTKVRAVVGNGGFSLRRNAKCIRLLKEMAVERQVFLAGGSSEDLFFAFMGQLSTDFVIPNEITASLFSMERLPLHYLHVNGGRLPLGLHAWFKNHFNEWASLLKIPEGIHD
jgi:hypothetical protein